jgi:MFS family permease
VRDISASPGLKRTIGILGFTQVVSWGGLYYAFAILAPQIQREMGWSAELVYGAFSWCLLVAGLASPAAGMMLDRLGGRPVMAAGSLVCGAGFLLLASAHSILAYFGASTVLGIAMAMVLYEAAFATLNHAFRARSRDAISTLTLFGGFASTVFWPLTAKLDAQFGWRATYLIFGAVQILLCAPMHLLMQPKAPKHHDPVHASPVPHSYSLHDAVRHPAFWKLACAFAANSFIFSALSVHLIPLLQAFGHTTAVAVFLAATIGPMQVAGRIGERLFGQAARPHMVGNISFVVLPIALSVLLLAGGHQSAAAGFCALYGLSNGILTIVRGTVPQALFGPENYGAISGALAGPALLAKAAGPLVLAAVVQRTPSPDPIIGFLFAASLISLACYLAAVRVQQHPVALRP